MKNTKARPRASSIVVDEKPSKKISTKSDENHDNPLVADLSSSSINKAKLSFDAAKPFPHCVLQPVFTNSFLESVLTELERKAKWQPLCNDLYKFSQSDDLKKTKLPNLARMRDIIYSPIFRAFISGVTGIELGEQVDASAACYNNGDRLLCHDDELEGRRVAYIFYLVPRSWTLKDGGALELYDADDAGEARDVVKSIEPLWNSCVFFPVTNKSWHRVAEITSSDKTRYSISGWFHGAPLPRPPPARDILPPLQPLTASTNIDLSEWVNAVYLKPATIKQIKQHFIEQGSVQLHSFLLPERYEALAKALDKFNNKWRRVTPANRRQYSTADRTSATGVLRAVLEMLQSTTWANFLASITSLSLVKGRIEARCFGRDNYTLTQDAEELASHRLLDALLSIAPQEWDEDWGGATVYLSPEAELLTAPPVPNALTIAYRAGSTEEPVMRFTQYVSLAAPEPIYDISAMYFEDDEEDVDESMPKKKSGYGGARAKPAAPAAKSSSRKNKQKK